MCENCGPFGALSEKPFEFGRPDYSHVPGNDLISDDGEIISAIEFVQNTQLIFGRPLRFSTVSFDSNSREFTTTELVQDVYRLWHLTTNTWRVI